MAEAMRPSPRSGRRSSGGNDVDLALSEEQQQLVAALRRLVAAGQRLPIRSGRPSRRASTRRSGTPLIGPGALAMAVPEARGGWGATLLDLALVAEQLGRGLAPAPVIESQVAARLLASVGSARRPRGAGPALLPARRLISLALHPVRSTAWPPWRRRAPSVTTSSCSTGTAWCWSRHPARRAQAVANLGAAPLADVTLQGGTELAQRPEAARRVRVGSRRVAAC